MCAVRGHPWSCKVWNQCFGGVRRRHPVPRPLLEVICFVPCPAHQRPLPTAGSANRYLKRYPGIHRLSPHGEAMLLKEKGWVGEVNWPFANKPMVSEDERRHYGSYFAASDWRETFSLDKSTSYLGSQRAAKRMHAVMPNAKPIVVVCDPAKRVWSDLNQWHFKVARDIANGKTAHERYHKCRIMQKGFTEEALKQLETLVSTGSPVEELCPVGGREGFATCSICGYLRGSYYARYLRAWRAEYGDGGVLVVDGDDLRFRPRETVRGSCFCGFVPKPPPCPLVLHFSKPFSAPRQNPPRRQTRCPRSSGTLALTWTVSAHG